jgi:hypothetical protein
MSELKIKIKQEPGSLRCDIYDASILLVSLLYDYEQLTMRRNEICINYIVLIKQNNTSWYFFYLMFLGHKLCILW